ncbi:sulfite exporter TauE/SafE family protein [Clostridium sp. D53t1_180928_C8]|uniref:sulfite exporter TauE/SafE family protein n=1 Tax=Clostridium sp. D53t1_180928_C8 TaxID=2787101 RepID=UPI0018AB3AA9|nr:sulfite exporter TauE/SafE family protein [Clostridium sp. D53t1_180928_C8]
MELNKTILFALIIMCTYFIEGLIGFGGTIMALPLASMVMGLKLTVPVMTVVVLIASIIIAARDYKYIDIKQFVKIALLMILGLPIGMWLFKFLPERPLKILLGIFMIGVAIKGLYDVFIKVRKQPKLVYAEEFAADSQTKDLKVETPKGMRIVEDIILFLGGIIHGAFTCGGPFVVVYATKNIKNKSSFRATLCALWATLNIIMLSINIFNGEINFEIIKISAITMIFVFIAIVVSNIVHKKINGDIFTKFVYIALFISGILMML